LAAERRLGAAFSPGPPRALGTQCVLFFFPPLFVEYGQRWLLLFLSSKIVRDDWLSDFSFSLSLPPPSFPLQREKREQLSGVRLPILFPSLFPSFFLPSILFPPYVKEKSGSNGLLQILGWPLPSSSPPLLLSLLFNSLIFWKRRREKTREISMAAASQAVFSLPPPFSPFSFFSPLFFLPSSLRRRVRRMSPSLFPFPSSFLLFFPPLFEMVGRVAQSKSEERGPCLLLSLFFPSLFFPLLLEERYKGHGTPTGS